MVTAMSLAAALRGFGTSVTVAEIEMVSPPFDRIMVSPTYGQANLSLCAERYAYK
jgi:hypothetical protein